MWPQETAGHGGNWGWKQPRHDISQSAASELDLTPATSNMPLLALQATVLGTEGVRAGGALEQPIQICRPHA